VKKILMAMHVKLTAGEDASWSHKYFKGQRGLDCYLKVMEGWDFLGLLNVDANRKAEKLARETMALCPENPLGYLILGWVHWSDCILESTKSPRESFEQAMAMAQKTLAMDDSAVGAHDLLCSLYPFAGAHDRAIAAGERAVALEPNGAIANEHLAWSLFWAGRPQEAIPIVQKAIRLNPLGAPSSFLILAHAYASMGRFEEAVSTYKKVLLWKSGMDIHAHLGLAASCVELGREKEARAEAAEVLRIKPGFTLEAYAKTHPYKDQSKRDRYFSALRKAGLN
jgi:tetratricopeptide (TPR) repeat protein